MSELCLLNILSLLLPLALSLASASSSSMIALYFVVSSVRNNVEHEHLELSLSTAYYDFLFLFFRRWGVNFVSTFHGFLNWVMSSLKNSSVPCHQTMRIRKDLSVVWCFSLSAYHIDAFEGHVWMRCCRCLWWNFSIDLFCWFSAWSCSKYFWKY